MLLPSAPTPSPLLVAFLGCYRDLVRFLTRRTGSQDEANAIAHDTWIRLTELAQRDGLTPPTCPSESRAYIFTSARHLAIDRLRHQQTVQRHADHHAAPTLAASPDEAESLMYRQAIGAVDGALAGLPDRARQVFLRNKVHGEDQSDLAREFGVSRNLIERDMMLAMDRVEAAMHRWHGSRSAVSHMPRQGRRQSLSALLGLGAFGLGGAALWRWAAYATPQWQDAYATQHAQRARHVLPDGSVLTLDAASRVDVTYYGSRRVVSLLAGAAFFEVTPEPARPFQVDVARQHDGVRVTVLGTRFGVEREPSDAVRIEVESGRVAVEPTGKGRWPRQELTAAQRLRVLPHDDRRPPAASIERHDHVSEAASWRHGMVAFDNQPLDDVIDRLRRYVAQTVDLDAAVSPLRLSGQVRTDKVDDFLAALPRILPVAATLADGRWQVTRPGR
ncbi:sigma-70 family RNA polymerase sigma factor [Pigmentiphaga litoralis]|uniref:RNA polymerase sigma factor (Sigma-70 family) n=1 Tax=Pigmentiphaga litoralis TaxID=516702 RepID=A0A7Y9LN48_9BURK|nr:sigma-70 family RNA polymerase sigma factor [Pigmentiphaga litoralis]NYE26484.1 RNA polymerase sigma factor (sigma-70 family) [Pigmentiphaga litoralis]NYE85604.1 RNA polymerase sigma factor (sigma-70 family) [Pigmentiphaga litoralis]